MGDGISCSRVSQKLILCSKGALFLAHPNINKALIPFKRHLECFKGGKHQDFKLIRG